MNKILSIIIPTYNMEALLDGCLSSLVLDTFEKRQLLDVIVVNDGSKDRSSDIAHEYARKYPEMFSVIDKENGNYGSCINAALPHVRGKYVRILDADDRYLTENLTEYLNVLNAVDVDMVLSDYVTVNEFGEERDTTIFPLTANEVMGFSELPDYCPLAMHAVAYRSGIFDEIDYHQTEGVSYTDMEWIFHPLTRVKSLYYFHKPIYRYLLGREGQSVDTITMIKRLNHREKGVYSQLKIINSLHTDNPAYKRMENMIQGRLQFIYYNSFSRYSDFDLKRLDSTLERDYPYFYKELEKYYVPVGILNIQMPIVKIWRRFGNKKAMVLHPLYALHLIIKLFRK